LSTSGHTPRAGVDAHYDETVREIARMAAMIA